MNGGEPVFPVVWSYKRDNGGNSMLYREGAKQHVFLFFRAEKVNAFSYLQRVAHGNSPGKRGISCKSARYASRLIAHFAKVRLLLSF